MSTFVFKPSFCGLSPGIVHVLYVTTYTGLLELPLPRIARPWSLSGSASAISTSSAAALLPAFAARSPVRPGLSATDALLRSASSPAHAPTSTVVEPPRAFAAVVALPRLALSRPMRSTPPQLQPPRRRRHAQHCHAAASADATRPRHHVCPRRALADVVCHHTGVVTQRHCRARHLVAPAAAARSLPPRPQSHLQPPRRRRACRVVALAAAPR